MLDIKTIRQNPENLREALKKRKSAFNIDAFLEKDNRYRKQMREIEELRSTQNKISKEIQQLLKEKKDATSKINANKELRQKLDSLKTDFQLLSEEYQKDCLTIPNIPHSSTPVGNASCNKVIKQVNRLNNFNFKPLDHIQIGQNLQLIDFERAIKLSGSNFVLFKGLGAALERALINFMLNLHTSEHNYTEISPPVLTLSDSMYGTGQLPNLKEDMYKIEGDNLYLIPTAEVPLTNIHREEVIDENCLPIKYTGYTTCFRREAGSYGKETRGLMRLHQFDKIELVKFVKPENSYSELETLLSDACQVLNLLNLPYRVVLLASEDISFAAAKCYDIEVYAPGVDRWLEVSSCSNFEDFQARRANIRYKQKDGGKNEFLHTLNGSGVALPRLVIAILENYQQEDGSVIIPEILKKYLNGRERIKK